jgi:hypothetical protein
MNPLEQATTQELIDELSARATFRGVLVWQPDYHGRDCLAWKFLYSHCDPVAVCAQMVEQLQARE